jgi:hypothetical protein
MAKLECIDINDNIYYNSLKLKEFDPTFFDGCNNMTRAIIKTKNIPVASYIYATFSSGRNEWKVYDNTGKVPPKAVLYIEKEWADKNVTGLKDNSKNKKNSSKNRKNKNNNNDNDNNNDIDDYLETSKVVENDNLKATDESSNDIDTPVSNPPLTSNYTSHECNVSEVYKKSATSTVIPCIYLFTLGYVKDLRQAMKIDMSFTDDMVICKYGYTANLSRQTTEYMKTFGKLNGVDLQLKFYSYIDPQYDTNAEIDIKDYFDVLDAKLEFQNNEEFVVIDTSLFKKIEKQYKQIASEYAGYVKELMTQLNKKDMEIELIKKDKEINLLKKDLEIEKLKNQCMLSNKK